MLINNKLKRCILTLKFTLSNRFLYFYINKIKITKTNIIELYITVSYIYVHCLLKSCYSNQMSKKKNFVFKIIINNYENHFSIHIDKILKHNDSSAEIFFIKKDHTLSEESL